MKNATLVTTYFIRNFPVQVLRVAESSGNPEARNYQPSDFEKATFLKEEGQIDSALALLDQFVSQHPHNFSGYMTLAEIYYDRRHFEKAALFLGKASRFDPTSYLTHRRLGTAYLDLYVERRDGTYRLLAIEEWEKALKLFPQDTYLAAQLKRIRGN